MNPIVIGVEAKNFPSNRIAITLFPFILIRKDRMKDKCLRKHEEYHWNEIWKWGKYTLGLGILVWYILYALLLIWPKYRRNNEPWFHPMESEAYKIEWRCQEERSR